MSSGRAYNWTLSPICSIVFRIRMITISLQVIEQMRRALGDRIRLSIVMPFWFSDKTARERPLAFQIMNRVDEVAVMSYRTDLEELEDISEPLLRYGDAVGVPVWLAVRRGPYPSTAK